MTASVSRRRLLATLGTTVGVGLTGCSGLGDRLLGDQFGRIDDCSPYDPVETSATTWPTAFGGPAGMGTVAVGATPEAELTVDWTLPIETYIGYHVPIVDEDTVYAHDLETDVFAVGADSGEERWRTTIEDPGPPPAVGDGYLVVVTETGVEAVDAATGTTEWTTDTPLGDIFDAPPVIANGTVFLPSGISIHALDLATGDRRWRVPVGLSMKSCPAVVDGVLYVAGDDTYVRAFATADGREHWRYKTSARIECNVAVEGGAVYTGTEAGEVVALDAESGDERWRYELPSDGRDRRQRPQTVATDGSRVYVTTDGALYVLDAVGGTPCWRSQTYAGSYASGVAVGDGKVHIPIDPSNAGGTGAVFDAATGGRIHEFTLGGDHTFDVGPSLAGGALYTNGRGGIRRLS